MAKRMKGLRYPMHQEIALHALHFTLDQAPGFIHQLLLEHQVNLSALPSRSKLQHAALRLIHIGPKRFRLDLIELAEFIRQKQRESQAYDTFLPALLGAVGSATGAVGSVVESKQNRKAVEAESRAQIATAKANARAGFQSNLMALNAQFNESSLVKSLSDNKRQVYQMLIAAGVLSVFGFLGFRYWKNKQLSQRTK